MPPKFAVTPADFYFRRKKWLDDSYGTQLLKSRNGNLNNHSNNNQADDNARLNKTDHVINGIPERENSEKPSKNAEKRDSLQETTSMTQAGYPVTGLDTDEEIMKLKSTYPDLGDTKTKGPAPPLQKAQSSFLAFKRVNYDKTEESPMGAQKKPDSFLMRAYLNLTFPSIRVLFTLVTSLILATTVAIMIIFTVLRGNSLQATLSLAISTSIIQRASFFLTELLGSSLLLAMDRTRFLHLNPDSLANSDLMVRSLYVSVSDAQPFVSQLYQANSDGLFTLAGRDNITSPVYINFVNQTTGPDAFTRRNFLINPTCDAYNFSCPFFDPSHPVSSAHYNAQLRPWYKTATDGLSSWTDIYFYQRTGLPGITGVDPYYENGVLKSVSAVDITLDSIGIFLRSLAQNLQSTRVIFIVNRTNYIIACGGQDDEILMACESIDGRNLTLNSTIPWILDSGDYVTYPTINDTMFFETSAGFYSVLPYSFKGISWVIVSVMDRNTSSSSYFTLVAIVGPIVGIILLLISIVLTYFITKRLTTSLKGVTKKLLSVSNLEVDPTSRIIEVRSIIKEVNEIENATTTLIYGLRSFSKYVPQEIVKLLIKAKREANLGLDEAEISIFFSDIANFTTISENLTPRELVALLGEYLMEMSDIVQCTGGLVDKYIGDAVMAFWNAPNPIARHELAACEAALLSQSRLAELREKWIDNGFPKVEARIGIHSSKSRVGNVGSSTRFNYTCIGDGVNLASRLEGLNKVYSTSILVSGTVHDKVNEFMLTRLLDVVAVKGKSKAVRIYELIKKSHMAQPEEEANCKLFKRAFENYLRRDFKDAISLFQEYLNAVPGDKAAKLHINNCQKFIASPPPSSWTGVARYEEK